MEKTVDILQKDLCTGCGACFNACPADAIAMQPNEEGFLEPVIDGGKCINCGKCERTCPVLHPDYSNNKSPDCFAAWAADEIRRDSSSGGVFSVLADYVFENDGYVCGAAFDEEMELRHIITDSPADMPKLRGSKYLQSDSGYCYRKIKKLLLENKPVLFCGVPCQVAGLNNFLGKKYDNLITVDLLCHGGISPLVFKRYLKECFPDRKVVDYKFRNKEYGWIATANAYFSDGTEYHNSRDNDLFYRAFTPCYAARKSCGTCKAAALPRQGDFTLGDFWGCRDCNEEFDDGKGTSLVFVNNRKAARLLHKLKPNFPLLKKARLGYITEHTGQPLAHPFKKTTFMHDRFYFYLRHGTLEKAVTYCEKGKFDVAIAGVWYGWNYGSVLTNYALYRYLRSLGLLVLMIEKPCQKPGSGDIELNPSLHSRAFALKHYGADISRPRMPEEMWQLNAFADTFIVGSDQLWHYNIERSSKGAFLLNFVSDSHKRIAYSTSFGHDKDYTPKEEFGRRKTQLKKFDHISVRESSGLDILGKYGVSGSKVLDPVFIAERKIFDELADSVDHGGEKFIAAYILDPTPEKTGLIARISEKLGLPVKALIDGMPAKYNENKEKMGLPIVEKPSVEQWIHYFKNAEFIITDSYHGTCFSIIFKKKFIAIGNALRGLARFNTIFDIIGNRERLIVDPAAPLPERLITADIDYDDIEQKLRPHIDFSKNWLNNAIYSDKVINELPVYRIIDLKTKRESDNE